MIINFIIHTILVTIQSIFSVLPTIPATPTALSDGGQWIIDQIVLLTSVLRMFLGTTLFTAIIVVLIAIFTFEWIYHTVMWIVRKIPVINIK